jgi:hypothetical protein
MRERLGTGTLEPALNTPDQFRDDRERASALGAVIKDAGIRQECAAAVSWGV